MPKFTEEKQQGKEAKREEWVLAAFMLLLTVIALAAGIAGLFWGNP